MPQLKLLHTIFKKHRWQLMITYFLFSLEMAGTLLIPYCLGKTIDDLTEGNYNWLIVLCSVRVVWMIVGIIRQRYDTRTYTAIYNSIIAKAFLKKYSQAEVSKLSALSSLSREFVDFLEHDLVYIIEAGYYIFGSLIFLLSYDFRVVGLCLAILLPVLAVSYYYGKQMKKLNKEKNDELEKQVDIIASQNTLALRRHYEKLRHWQIKISDKQAWNFGVMEVLSIVAITISLIITQAISTAVLEAGAVVGIYSYVTYFVKGLDTIPYAVEKFASLSDITRRMELEEEELLETEPPTKAANE
jgi:ABC-type multidrug transport system fused ATPase/permease subunit